MTRKTELIYSDPYYPSFGFMCVYRCPSYVSTIISERRQNPEWYLRHECAHATLVGTHADPTRRIYACMITKSTAVTHFYRSSSKLFCRCSFIHALARPWPTGSSLIDSIGWLVGWLDGMCLWACFVRAELLLWQADWLVIKDMSVILNFMLKDAWVIVLCSVRSKLGLPFVVHIK